MVILFFFKDKSYLNYFFLQGIYIMKMTVALLLLDNGNNMVLRVKGIEDVEIKVANYMLQTYQIKREEYSIEYSSTQIDSKLIVQEIL